MTRQEEETVDVEQLEQTRKAWDRIATGYDRFVTPTHTWLAKEALRRSGLQEGDRFLDVAAGSGALSLTAAQDGARVTAVDLSPKMVERLENRALDQGFRDLQARVMDGHALDLEDNTFDVTGSQFGVMLFPDLPRGLREMVRVTRPGGRVVTVLFGPAEKVEFLGFFIKAKKAVVPDFAPPPLDQTGSPFQAADPRVFRERLSQAGLKEIQVETVTEELRFTSGDEMWDWLMNSNPVAGMLVADLNEAQRARLRRTLDGMLRERSGGQGPAVLSNQVHIGIGTV